MAAGDERALGELYDAWVERVHALALALLRDAAEAEDVTEETFWQAWRQADRFDDSRGTVSGWLLTITRSRALDRLRARRRRPEEPLPDSIRELAAESSSAAQDVELLERSQVVRRALGTLPAEQREVLLLAYYGGFSQSEIAERLSQPLGTVKTRVRLGLARLRTALSGVGEAL